MEPRRMQGSKRSTVARVSAVLAVTLMVVLSSVGPAAAARHLLQDISSQDATAQQTDMPDALMEESFPLWHKASIDTEAISQYNAAALKYLNGTYINCGGARFVGRNTTWQTDELYSGGEVFGPRRTQIATSAPNLLDKTLFESMRFFGGQDGPYNTYSIPVTAGAGYYWVRLYFAEILYTSAAVRKFDVKIEGVMVLSDFSPPANASLKEFMLPVLDGAVDITFVRGAIGDPMINGISVVPVPSGQYGLTLANNTVYATEYRLGCGQVEPLMDFVGRIWAPDVGFFYDFGKKVVSRVVFMEQIYDLRANYSEGQKKNLLNTANLFPPELFLTSRQTEQYAKNGYYGTVAPAVTYKDPANVLLMYSFDVAPNTQYYLRLGFAELRARNYLRQMNIYIDGQLVVKDLDIKKTIGYNGPLFEVFLLTTNSTGKLSFLLQNNFTDVLINTIEILRQLPFDKDAQSQLSATIAALTAAPSAKKSDRMWSGVGVGIAIGLFLALAAIAALLLYPLRTPKKGDDEKETAGDSRKGPKGSLLQALLTSYSQGSFNGANDDAKSTKSASTKAGLLKRSASVTSMDSAGARAGLYGTQAFSLDELSEATHEFSEDNILGAGGFGVVYHAKLWSGHAVAVKRLDMDSQQGEREFMTEVELLSRLHHRYLVNLIGYCDEDNQLMLLEGLFSTSSYDIKSAKMTWETRLRVALGAARGIEYLHRGANPPVIHRDIKTSNILLDYNFDAKVADFGLSKLVNYKMAGLSKDEQQTHISTHVKGTVGMCLRSDTRKHSYLDPNYYAKQQLTEKSDVYSFGVVLLELLTGRLPIWQQAEEDGENERLMNLIEWTAPFMKNGEDVTKMFASPAAAAHAVESAKRVAIVARLCVEVQAKRRPTMTEVVRELEEAKKLLESAPPPSMPSVADAGAAKNDNGAPSSLPPVRLSVAPGAAAPVDSSLVSSLTNSPTVAGKGGKGGGAGSSKKGVAYAPGGAFQEPVSISIIED
eukprot:jgi/Mesen1/9692/ME000069S09097